ncbi:uncharacterized protein LOC107487641 [Arachis duranensis]|uniref:Uncharacterized protein LOC107487641 n=2 Tax=Arachis TaxID=3817 RepID=A0A6P4D809_ARADU|nr:uncharacterized protein LOC107487641 [Arachis duranensis]XP_025698569.1 uncharacterized protein LOC112800480 [Arachis hypogaea]XP_052118161.1 uncharacterized protein LOC107487641 [Arachis duranensis]RYQ80958.1 hypothetical protein Ahy_Scaffold1g107013 [Arachis hypogaea]
MKPEERKRRFNEAIVNILYPSSPEPETETEPSHQPIQQDLKPVDAFTQRSPSHAISGSSDDYDNASTSGDEEHDSGTVKLTRAQRKKIRKKKLKEDAIRRGNLIGPLLPPYTHQVTQDAPPVRSNASTEPSLHVPGDGAAPSTSKRTRKRRMAKKLPKVMPQTSNSAPFVKESNL